MRLNAVAEEPIKVNGEIIATKLNPLGSIEITEVQPKGSFAKILAGKGALTKGTKVIETLPTAPSLPVATASPATS